MCINKFFTPFPNKSKIPFRFFNIKCLVFFRNISYLCNYFNIFLYVKASLVYFIDNDISKIFIFYVIASDYFHFGRYQIFYESEIFRFVIYKPEHKVFVI